MTLNKPERVYVIILVASALLVLALLLFFFGAAKEAKEKEPVAEQTQENVEEPRGEGKEEEEDSSKEARSDDGWSGASGGNAPEGVESKGDSPKDLGIPADNGSDSLGAQSGKPGFAGGSDSSSAGAKGENGKGAGRSSSGGASGANAAGGVESKSGSSNGLGVPADNGSDLLGAQGGMSGSASGSDSSSAGAKGENGKGAGRSSSGGASGGNAAKNSGSKNATANGSDGSGTSGDKSDGSFWHRLFHTAEPAASDGGVPVDGGRNRVEGARSSPSDGAKQLRRIEKELEKARAAAKKGEHKEAFELACSVCSEIRQGDYQRVGVDGEGKQANQFEGMLKEAFQLAEENGRNLSLELPEDEGPLFIEF